MKRQVLLSALAAALLFAVSTTAEAGLFGRLHTIRGCAPCEPAACQPCEQAAPPCEAVCEPCEPSCFDGCHKPFRPFGGFFLGLKAKLDAKLHHGCVPACEPVCEVPCEPCREVAPCEEVACDACGHHGSGPFLPFGGFFLNLKAKLAAHLTPCSPCGVEPVCEPCVPACEPCH
ncbi:MAG: hypothetical protein LBN39_08510 [Planctomycetaceae bacterium]|jgi:hypothetical protein|nr:hypothetical protein [Planctomycetaceae bacterium]